MPSPQPFLGKGIPFTYTSVTYGAVKNVSSPKISADTVDVTSLTDSWKRFLVTIPDAGELTLSIYFDPANSDHAGLPAIIAAGAAHTAVINYPDSHTWTASAFLTNLEFPEVEVGTPVMADLTLKIDGAVTLT